MNNVEFLEKYLKYLNLISLDIVGVKSAEILNEGMQQSIKFIIKLFKNPKMLEQFIKIMDNIINLYEKAFYKDYE